METCVKRSVFNYKAIAASLIAGLVALIARPAPAADTEITIHADQTIQTLDKNWFGSGSEYFNPAFPLALKSPRAVETMHDLGVSFLRWPHGTCALWYFWDAPSQSYQPGKNRLALTPQDFFDAAKLMNAESVVQVNTYQYRRGDADFERSKVLVGPGNIGEAAKYAAKWVADAKAKGYNIKWWEIGNEDWVYWTGRQHAEFVVQYAKAMKAADPSIKILAQGMPGDSQWKMGFNQSDGQVWMDQLVDRLEPGSADGISLHTYIGGRLGDTKRLLKDELSTMYAENQRARGMRYVVDLLKKKNRSNLELWVTEFNVTQKDPKGIEGFELMQNVAHGLAVADWLGSHLQLGIKRVGYHDMVGHPVWTLFDVVHWGKPESPRIMAPGLAVMAFTKDFGNRIVSVERTVSPQLSADCTVGYRGDAQNQKLEKVRYDAVSVYSSRRDEDKTLRVVAINRDSDQARSLALAIQGARPSGVACATRRFGADVSLEASNIKQAETVKWTAGSIPLSELGNIQLPPHSLTVIEVPLAE